MTELEPFLDGADYVEFKEIESENSLREFIAGVFGWSPGWVKVLYGLRYPLARVLRLETARPRRRRTGEIGFEPGDAVGSFTVRAGDPERYLVVGADDSHLSGYLTVEAVPRGFRLGTIVHFHNRVGPAYFALIKPFHHLVIRAMLRAGAARPA
ncbi:hypothetical protein Amsp01_007030 [Amycolatopsis sp. NBRC 101858]|uniref:DUF2867 domain-containing protein n=1 Tax=Amycolatopsis sp. NBRC 101858 TaxID=3032200 RepID=UPI0024A215E4|nr:DUF2867 domain-containing protein [Amycolatopsis sp. NBRC 101858]GLY34679.1 hypothetical protein Amsp01_007030 [Amycolatopsis sp. NBRC 101858]